MRLSVNQTTTVSIHAKIYWNETGLEIEPGEVYLFAATGEWYDWWKSCDAAGYSNHYMNMLKRFRRSKENEVFALIGSLDQSGHFLVGKGRELSFQEGGILYCYANDLPFFYWNNKGFVSLEITRLK